MEKRFSRGEEYYLNLYRKVQNGLRSRDEDLDIPLSFRLPNSASIFLAGVSGIEEACGVLLNNYGRIQRATIDTYIVKLQCGQQI